MVGQVVDDAAHLNIVSGGQGVAGHSGANGAELKFVDGLTAHSASCASLRCKASIRAHVAGMPPADGTSRHRDVLAWLCDCRVHA